jgi:cell division protein FtsI/penicillin-binding protein 2
VNKEELSAYISRIRDIESRRRFDWIVDRNGAPLIYKKVGESEWEYADVSMEWLKPTMLGLKDDDYYSLIRLTIDIRVQKEAYESLGNHEGALLLMKQDGQLLAAVSKSKDNREPLFIKMLKPGSIVEIVTTSAALRNNIDLSNIFPINCKGFMVPYDKLIFYDWIEHGNVPSIVEALASSCNISFGIIGNKLGAELLKNELKEFGIGKEISLEGIRFKSGKVIDNVSDPLYNYMLSIGDTYV